MENHGGKIVCLLSPFGVDNPNIQHMFLPVSMGINEYHVNPEYISSIRFQYFYYN